MGSTSSGQMMGAAMAGSEYPRFCCLAAAHPVPPLYRLAAHLTAFLCRSPHDGTIGENKDCGGWDVSERVFDVWCAGDIFCSFFHGDPAGGNCLVSNATGVWWQGSGCSTTNPRAEQVGISTFSGVGYTSTRGDVLTGCSRDP